MINGVETRKMFRPVGAAGRAVKILALESNQLAWPLQAGHSVGKSLYPSDPKFPHLQNENHSRASRVFVFNHLILMHKVLCMVPSLGFLSASFYGYYTLAVRMKRSQGRLGLNASTVSSSSATTAAAAGSRLKPSPDRDPRQPPCT